MAKRKPIVVWCAIHVVSKRIGCCFPREKEARDLIEATTGMYDSWRLVKLQEVPSATANPKGRS